MSTSKWIGLSIAAACAVVAVLAWQRTPSSDPADAAASGKKPVSGWFQAQTGASAAQDPSVLGPGMGPGTGSAGKGKSPLDSVAPPQFKVDAQGQLEMNSQTRDGIEQLASLYEREQAQAKMTEATQGLPAGAQRAAQDLLQRYQQYMQALRQAFPPQQQEHMSLQQAKDDFDKLQQVRKQYLGEAADALWARDDAVTRTLLNHAGEFMAKDPKLSLAEASQMAQDRYAREMEGLQARPAPPPLQR